MSQETSRQKRAIIEKIYQFLLDQGEPHLKQSVALRVAEKLSLAFLGNRLTGWDPIHVGSLRAVTAFEQLPAPLVRTVIQSLCEDIFYGQVIPVQKVKEVIAQAQSVYLGKCVCRFSGRTNDLYRSPQEDKKVYSIASPEVEAEHFEKLLDAYSTILSKGEEQRIAQPLQKIFSDFLARRDRKDSEGTLPKLWEATWPWWEILVDHQGFTDAWKNTMAQNSKVWSIHPDLLQVWEIGRAHV